MIVFFLALLLILLLFTNTFSENYTQDTLANKVYHQILLEKSNPAVVHKNLCNVPMYVINLERSPDRRQFIDEQAKVLGLNLAFIDAVDGKKLNSLNEGTIPYKNKSIKYILQKPDVSKSELGCTLSHLKAILTAYENNDRYALTVEDDVSFSLISHWDETINDVIQNAPSDWGWIVLNNLDNYDKSQHGKYIKTTGKTLGARAQLISRKGMEDILHSIYINNEFVLKKTDPQIYKLASDNYLPYLTKSYIYRNQLFSTYNDDDGMESTIHPNHTGGHVGLSKNIFKEYLNKLNINSDSLQSSIHHQP